MSTPPGKERATSPPAAASSDGVAETIPPTVKHRQIGAHAFDLNYRDGLDVDFVTPVPLMTVRYDLQEGVASFDTCVPAPFMAEPYSVIIHPAGTRIRCTVPPRTAEFICIALGAGARAAEPTASDALIASLAMERENRLVVSEALRFPALALRRFLLSTRDGDAASGNALVLRLLTLALDDRRELGAFTRTPKAETMQRIAGLVRRDLSGAISVGRLAGEAEMSEGRFARTFKRVMRETPYQYVIQRRLDHARDLLARDLQRPASEEADPTPHVPRSDRQASRSTDRSLADIALAAGFTSQAHMTAMFRDVLGVTPHRYRAALVGRGPTGPPSEAPTDNPLGVQPQGDEPPKPADDVP
ncbi:MAG: AraC family transcriptional regulator [Pseudomonadota bacterium]